MPILIRRHRLPQFAVLHCDLFSIPEYLLQLYQALHPEDTETDQDDLTIITFSSTFIRAMYNDLGFLAGNRLLILVEHQSKWSENIVARVLLYVVETWNKYIKQKELDVYDKDKITLPKPELYVIYTPIYRPAGSSTITTKTARAGRRL